jgi:hypothetical protein
MEFDMIDGTIIRYSCSFFFLKKKHTCFNCDGILIRRSRKRVVHSESEEAKNYDFGLGDTYLHGNIKFITYYFECPKCKTAYEIMELKQLEKASRKKSKQN